VKVVGCRRWMIGDDLDEVWIMGGHSEEDMVMLEGEERGARRKKERDG